MEMRLRAPVTGGYLEPRVCYIGMEILVRKFEPLKGTKAWFSFV